MTHSRVTCAVLLLAATTATATVTPILHNGCVVSNGDGTFTATWDYNNDKAKTEKIELGKKNEFIPAPADRGQPEDFLPGLHTNVFSTVFSGGTLTWQLDKSDAVASSAVVCGSSGGGGGGIESDGEMATLLAQRLFERSRKQSLAARPARATRAIGNNAFANASWITDLAPQNGPFGSTAVVVTPADLLGVTNANEIYSVDYAQPDGTRIGSVFLTATGAGEVYSHTKVVCDRLKGGSLQDVRVIDIGGYSFIEQEFVTASGEVDTSISFAAAFSHNGTATIDSRWNVRDYDVAASSGVLNFQVWTVSRAATQLLVQEILRRIATHATLFAATQPAPRIPDVYVRRGEYRNGVLRLELVNRTGASSVRVSGTVARSEQGTRHAVAWVLPVEAGPATIHIPTGPIFDAALAIESTGDGKDAIYYADGPWFYSYDHSGARIESFRSHEEAAVQSSASMERIERSAELTGGVTTWVSLYRFLHAGRQPRDMSRYAYIEFTAQGRGRIELVLEKNAIASWWDQYRTYFDLSDEPRRYRINFHELNRTDGLTGFTAEDLVSIDFNAVGNLTSERAFRVRISEVSFGMPARRRAVR